VLDAALAEDIDKMLPGAIHAINGEFECLAIIDIGELADGGNVAGLKSASSIFAGVPLGIAPREPFSTS